MLFGHKQKLQVELGDLLEEKEHLLDYLQEHLKTQIEASEHKLTFDSEKVSADELQKAVNKFIYRRNLNTKHYVSLDGGTVKINTFKGVNKKSEKQKKEPGHQTAIQSWGL